MFEELKFKFNYYWMDIEMWWDDLWMSDEEKAEIMGYCFDVLRKMRLSLSATSATRTTMGYN